MVRLRKADKRTSRRNALCHGLTAETVIDGLEDSEDYRGFEAAIIADYDAETAVERELRKGRAKSVFGRGGPRGAVAAKYRNPDNPSETWAGRGLRPRWLAAAIKDGKKLEDFAIAAPTAKAAKPGRKARKAGKAANK